MTADTAEMAVTLRPTILVDAGEGDPIAVMATGGYHEPHRSGFRSGSY